MKKILAFLISLSFIFSVGALPLFSVGSPVTASAQSASLLPTYTGTSTGISNIDTYNDCILMTVKGTDPASFSAYLNTLANEGYAVVSAERAILGTENKQAIYQNGSYLVNAAYIASSHEAKITVEPLGDLDLSVFTSANAATGLYTPLLIQIGLDGEGDAGTYGSGMSYVYRLSDGRFVIYDGGLAVSDEEHAARLYATLKQYAPDPNRIVIAAWIITHPHVDHIGALKTFSEYYIGTSALGNIRLEKLICNLPNIETQTYGNYELPAETVALYQEMLDGLKALGTDVYKAHVGQLYYVGDLTVEILFTADLLSPNELIGNTSTDGYTNSFSIISRAVINKGEDHAYSAIFTGDATYVSIGKVNTLYGEAMKSDFLQLPHHGALEQFPEDDLAVENTEKYANRMLLDLFYGDNTNTVDDPEEVSRVNSQYQQFYDEDGYGYVRAKYVLWPSKISVAQYYTETNPKRSTWDPRFHLVDETAAAGGGVYVAGSALTVFTFADEGVEVSAQQAIPSTVPVPTAKDGATLIYCAQDLAFMATNGNYMLARDIFVTGERFSPLANLEFSGTLRGDGHRILFTDTVTLSDTGGALFALLAGATVSDLTLGSETVPIQLKGIKTTGFQLGALAGSTTAVTSVTNVTVYADIEKIAASTASANIGGLVGQVKSGRASFADCYFDGTVTDSAKTATTNAGGIVGRVSAGVGALVVNCTSNGRINGNNSVGGMVGLVQSNAVAMLEGCVNSAVLTSFAGSAADTVGSTAENATVCALSDLIEMKSGAGVRAVSEQDSGLRFRIYVDSDKIDALTAVGYTIELGSLVAPTANVAAAGAFTKELLDELSPDNLYSARETDATQISYAKDDNGRDSYFASLINIREKNYATAFSAVGYMTVTNGDYSCTVYADYSAEGHSRTICEVAAEALKAENLDTNGLSEDQEKWLEKYIEES